MTTDTSSPITVLQERYEAESYWPDEYLTGAVPLLTGWLSRPLTDDDRAAVAKVLDGLHGTGLDVTDVFPFGVVWGLRACAVIPYQADLDAALTHWRKWEEEDHLGEPLAFLPELVPHYTLDEARERCLPGWNVRCNRCGNYGADWIANERPGWGWGNLALCPPHAGELAREHARHAAALRTLRAVNFEQDLHPTPTRLALLREVAKPMEVWKDDLTGESYIADGPKVTARLAEMEAAGWVEVDNSFWQLTDTGRAVLAARERR